jgi:hypothetical protein
VIRPLPRIPEPLAEVARSGLVCATLSLALGGPVIGQEIRGEVRIADSIPAPGTVVELHRITQDAGAVVDSVRTDDAGRFHFTPLDADDPGAVFLPAARHDGVLYWGRPVHATPAGGGTEPQRVIVYDTAVVEVPAVDLEVAMRHVVLTPLAGAGLRVEEVIDVRGREGHTLVSSVDSGAVWAASLGQDGRGAVVASGGVASQQLVLGGTQVAYTGALPPDGVRIAVGYVVPADEFRLTLTGPTRRLEVLLMDAPGLDVEVAGLFERSVGPDSPTGLRRFAGADLASGAIVSVEARLMPGRRSAAWVWLFASVILATAALFSMRHTRAKQAPSA